MEAITVYSTDNAAVQQAFPQIRNTSVTAEIHCKILSEWFHTTGERTTLSLIAQYEKYTHVGITNRQATLQQ